MLPIRVAADTVRPGINVARNAGARHATGEFILFVDADDIVSAGWLSEMAAAAEHADAVCGPLQRFLPGHQSSPVHADLLGLAPHRGFLPSPIGANAGVRTAVLRELGGFDETYPGGSDDTEFYWRLQLAGYEITEVPDALVHYRERSDLRSLAKQYRGFGRSEPHLFRDFRDRGMPPSSLRDAARVWVHLTIRVPRYWPDPALRRQWVRQVARRVGRVQGSIEWRCPYF